MRVYPQGDGVEFNAWFEATPGVPTIPPSVDWRLLCLTTKKELQPWTPVTPEVVTEAGAIVGVKAFIELDGALNAIQDSSNRRETKQLQVASGLGTSRQRSEWLEYAVANREV